MLVGIIFLISSEKLSCFRNVLDMPYKRIGYNINVIRPSAGLVINPITVDRFASCFNCTPVGRASGSVI